VPFIGSEKFEWGIKGVSVTYEKQRLKQKEDFHGTYYHCHRGVSVLAASSVSSGDRNLGVEIRQKFLEYCLGETSFQTPECLSSGFTFG
jgi:hypothetical protein